MLPRHLPTANTFDAPAPQIDVSTALTLVVSTSVMSQVLPVYWRTIGNGLPVEVKVTGEPVSP
jgi:hypothetical protein